MFAFVNSSKNNASESKTLTATESQTTQSNPVQGSVTLVVGHHVFLFLGLHLCGLLASQIDSSEEREEKRERQNTNYPMHQ